LYRSQLTWGAENDKLGVFEQFGAELGLDRGEFNSCLRSDRFAQEVTANRELAHALGLGGTPMVLVGTGGGMSRRLENYFFETIKTAVDEILGGTATNQ
jgi:protein-disulfide isomerase